LPKIGLVENNNNNNNNNKFHFLKTQKWICSFSRRQFFTFANLTRPKNELPERK